MTNQEFSNEFDVLYNNITSNQAPGLDEYEKSIFLTKAQDEIIKAYFDPRGNKFQQGFDDSERRQIDFSTLITIMNHGVNTNSNDIEFRNKGVGSINLPDDILMILNEQVETNRNGNKIILQVLPISYNEYTRLMSKPYKRPLKWQAWRVQSMGTGNNSLKTNRADLIAGANDVLDTYKIRYVKRPRPIILDALEGVSLEGYQGSDKLGVPVQSGATQGIECELDPILHHEILQRAVELAKAAYAGDLSSQIALGQNSETNMGIITQQSRQ